MEIRRFIGTGSFYKKLLLLSLPIIGQNIVTLTMTLVDTIMLSGLGTPQMSGVAIAGQLLTIATASAAGAVSGVGAFCAQQYGCGDWEGLRRSFRFKQYICLAMLFVSFVVFFFWGDSLIALYLRGESSRENAAAALFYGKQYLTVVTLSLPMFFADQVYASTLRQCGNTKIPMLGCATAVVLNMILDFALIPPMGVLGAALAMLIARTVQVTIVMVWTHRHPERMPFITGAYRAVRIPRGTAAAYLKKGLPLMLNESVYSVGLAIIGQCYSLFGLRAVAAMNINNALLNLPGSVISGFGTGVTILTGMLLGAGDMKKAKDENAKMVAAGLLIGLILGALLYALAPVLPGLYRAEAEVRALAERFLRIAAFYLVFIAAINMAYNTLIAGGKMIRTLIFDNGFMWAVNVPLAWLLSHFTGVDVVTMYLICCAAEIVRVGAGLMMIKKGSWLQNLTKTDSPPS